MTETPTDVWTRLVGMNVPGILAARRYAVPAGMLTAATGRRRAGDWRGACAAAGFEVRIDPSAVRNRYGAALLERLEDDLRHLVPDLARWHLPRVWRGGSGLLEPGAVVVLASYDVDAPGEPGRTRRPALWLLTGAHQERPQRPELHFGLSNVDAKTVHRWDGDRYLWDERATPRLLHRLGGGDRTPFFTRDGRRLADHELPSTAPAEDAVALTEWVTLRQDAGDFEAAWAAAGVEADFSEAETNGYRRGHWSIEAMGATVPALVARARAELADGAQVTLMSSGGWRPAALMLRRQGDQLSIRGAQRNAPDDLPAAPLVWWQRFVDLELLRTDQLHPDAVHPLVRTAMFPDRPDDGRYRPIDSTEDVATVSVRCRGVWHRVGWRGGRVEALDHPPEEAQRERVMRTLGGEVPRCFTVAESWQGRVGDRLPRRLRELRHQVLSAIAHGDIDELNRWLDLGIDPAGIRDRWNRGPLHLLAKVTSGGPSGSALLGRLLASGLDINGKDGKGRGPLGCVLFDGGSAELVRAMLDAGADPTAADDMGSTALHLLRSVDGATIVPWLVGAGVGLEQRDEYGRTPLLTQVLSDAPAETIRATLDAGADPGVSDEYTEQGISDLVTYSRRDDLDFLLDAARALGSTDD